MLMGQRSDGLMVLCGGYRFSQRGQAIDPDLNEAEGFCRFCHRNLV